MKKKLRETVEIMLMGYGWKKKNQCWEKGARRITFKARSIRMDHKDRGRWRRERSISYNPRIKDLEQFGSIIQRED